MNHRLAAMILLALAPALALAAGTNTHVLSGTSAATRARVVIIEDPAATVAFEPQLEVVRRMMERGLTNLTHRAGLAAAWRTFVSTQDVVGIKVYSATGPNSGTRPAVAAAVVEGLLAAGLPPQHIVIWDKHQGSLLLAGYGPLASRYGIRLAGSFESGYDTNYFYDTPLIGQLVWGDVDFERKGEGVGRKSYVSRLVTRELTKLINLTPLLNHNLVGVSGNLYGLTLGSVDNTLRFVNDADRLAVAVPDIYALPIMGDRVVLNIVDALIAQYYGEERTLLHYATELNQLRFSTDPVALDVLSLQELDRQRQAAKTVGVKFEPVLYHNASLVEIGVSDVHNIIVDTYR